MGTVRSKCDLGAGNWELLELGTGKWKLNRELGTVTSVTELRNGSCSMELETRDGIWELKIGNWDLGTTTVREEDTAMGAHGV